MSRTDQNAYRDVALSAALRELEVPDHAPLFFDELARRLAAERAKRPRRRPRLRWGMRIAVVAAGAGLVAALVGLPRADRTQVASAAVVKAQVRASLDGLRTLTGVIVTLGPADGEERRFRFSLDAQGDFRLEGPGPGEVIAYDASSGVIRSAAHSASMGGDTLFYAERRGVAPGPPDVEPATWLLPDELGAYVRALLAAGDPSVRDVDYEGRPAWHVDVETVPNAIVPSFSGDRLEITVDRETGIPVRVVETKAGIMLHELRIERLAVDESLPVGTFRPGFPAGAEVMRSDAGFRRVRLADAAGLVGYGPLVPTRVPSGYELSEVAVATASGSTSPANPPSRMVVSLAYRRGLDRFVVTTRLAGSGMWSDPLASGEGYVDRPESAALDTGELRGSDARLVLSPHGVPHLWVVAGGLVVTVAGDLSRAQLLSVADSLERHG